MVYMVKQNIYIVNRKVEIIKNWFKLLNSYDKNCILYSVDNFLFDSIDLKHN